MIVRLRYKCSGIATGLNFSRLTGRYSHKIILKILLGNNNLYKILLQMNLQIPLPFSNLNLSIHIKIFYERSNTFVSHAVYRFMVHGIIDMEV